MTTDPVERRLLPTQLRELTKCHVGFGDLPRNCCYDDLHLERSLIGDALYGAADRIEELEAAIAATHDGEQHIVPTEVGDEDLECEYCAERWPCWAAVALGREDQ